MPHRGRLNLLADLLSYSPTALFHKIKGGSEWPEELGAEGDVLSHLGAYFHLSRRIIPAADTITLTVSSPTLQYEGAENSLKVSLLPNPSHLGMLTPFALYVNLLRLKGRMYHTEAVNPVALGKTRAKQFSLLKTSPRECQLGDKVMCVQLHGDASFTGQGVVMESLGLSEFSLMCAYALVEEELIVVIK